MASLLVPKVIPLGSWFVPLRTGGRFSMKAKQGEKIEREVFIVAYREVFAYFMGCPFKVNQSNPFECNIYDFHKAMKV